MVNEKRDTKNDQVHHYYVELKFSVIPHSTPCMDIHVLVIMADADRAWIYLYLTSHYVGKVLIQSESIVYSNG